MGPKAGLDILGRKIFFPARNPTPDHPACSLVTILTLLPQWQEGGYTALFYLYSKGWENGFLWNVAIHLPECVESFSCRSQFKSYKPKSHKTWTLIIMYYILFLWVTIMSELTTVPSTTFAAACKLVYVCVVILFISSHLYSVSFMCIYNCCVSYCVHKSPQLAPTLRQINLVYTLMAYLFNVHFKFIILSNPKCPKEYFLLWHTKQNFLCLRVKPGNFEKLQDWKFVNYADFWLSEVLMSW